MDEIKIINSKIISVSFELFCAIIIFVLAFSIWINPNISVAKFASSNEEQVVLLEEVDPLELDNIYPIDDDTALKHNEKGIYKIINNSNVNSKYSLIYRVHNSSTLDYKFLKYQIIIDGESYVDFLSNTQISEENDYIDFTLYSGELDKLREKSFEYTMWIDSNVGNEAQNKVLSSEFVVKSYGTDVSIR